ncbi:hypothetical protein [Nocardia brasiliensis]|uniref:hypothetical protein n=1 Tax=Nocardia brasiliensis TaxID=37326 RepID=UPI00245374BA|nr:hypothetical protein [Nocardia brasiliensis]
MTRNSGYRIGSRALRPLLAAVVALALLAVAAPAPGAAPDSGRPGFAEYHGVRVSYFESLVPVAAQWAAISYFFGLAIPQIPELIIGTGVPTAIVNTITDLTLGQMDKIRNDPASVFHGPVTVPDTGAGINKYRWFVYHRLAHPEHDYIDVPRLRLYQMSDDAVETDVLNEGLAERTPHLDKDTLPGDHGSYIAGPDAETILDGVRATIDQAPQR